VFAVPEPRKLTDGQVEGLAKEALEAYLFGQRTRYDANGRLWDMHRMVGDDSLWRLELVVSLGGVELTRAAMMLDRVPSAEGEHQLIELVEAMCGQVHDLQAHWVSEQAKLQKARDSEPKPEPPEPPNEPVAVGEPDPTKPDDPSDHRRRFR
jgi:hypothetical protein